MEAVSILLKTLKSKKFITDVKKAEKEVLSEQIVLKKGEDLFIRDAVTGLGTILKEDLDNHYYVTTVKVGVIGNVLAQAIILRDGENADLAVYAHEGLIRQNLAKKAIEKLKAVLC